MTAHGNTEIAHKAMLNAAAAMAIAGIRMFEEPELVDKARAEWKEEVDSYQCPIPKEVGPRLED